MSIPAMTGRSRCRMGDYPTFPRDGRLPLRMKPEASLVSFSLPNMMDKRNVAVLLASPPGSALGVRAAVKLAACATGELTDSDVDKIIASSSLQVE